MRMPLDVSVSKGAFSACLIPNDAATPAGTAYRVSFTYSDPVQGSASWAETWYVRTSPTPLTVAQVQTIVAPSVMKGLLSSIPANGSWCIASTNGSVNSAWSACNTASGSDLPLFQFGDCSLSDFGDVALNAEAPPAVCSNLGSDVPLSSFGDVPSSSFGDVPLNQKSPL